MTNQEKDFNDYKKFCNILGMKDNNTSSLAIYETALSLGINADNVEDLQKRINNLFKKQ